MPTSTEHSLSPRDICEQSKQGTWATYALSTAGLGHEETFPRELDTFGKQAMAFNERFAKEYGSSLQQVKIECFTFCLSTNLGAPMPVAV